MTVSVTDQALFFAGALVMGAAVGLLYDAFRILRVRVRLPLLGGVLDLLFWLVVIELPDPEFTKATRQNLPKYLVFP